MRFALPCQIKIKKKESAVGRFLVCVNGVRPVSCAGNFAHSEAEGIFKVHQNGSNGRLDIGNTTGKNKGSAETIDKPDIDGRCFQRNITGDNGDFRRRHTQNADSRFGIVDGGV